MCSGAHGAMLAGGVDGRWLAFIWSQVSGRPASDRELRVSRGVATRNPVAILEQDLSVGTNQQRAEGGVPLFEGFAGELYATSQVLQILCSDHGSIITFMLPNQAFPFPEDVRKLTGRCPVGWTSGTTRPLRLRAVLNTRVRTASMTSRRTP